MSERAYALHCGISRPAVAKARMLGKLVHYPDGSIDAAASDKRRAAMTDPAKVRAVSATEAAADGTTLLQARIESELLKVEEQKLRVQRLQDSLIDRKKATATVMELARRARDRGPAGRRGLQRRWRQIWELMLTGCGRF
ncbi:MAG: hypothetical protein U1E66_05450 [Rhodospirillales bacterium]